MCRWRGSCKNGRLHRTHRMLLLMCLLVDHLAGLADFQVREQLQRLINIRRQKIEEGLQQVVSAATVRIDHLSAYESNLIRLTFQGTLNMFLKWDKVSHGATAHGTSNPCACAPASQSRPSPCCPHICPAQ